MRIQYAAAILLTGENEFLSPRQMAELLNYHPSQIYQLKRRLSNYCSENHFSGYPTLEQASDLDKKIFFYSTFYQAENNQTYPCYSGAIFKHHYDEKAQSLSASFLITCLFLKNESLYTPDDLHERMSDLLLLGDYSDVTESRFVTNLAAWFLEFLESPREIYGYQLKEVIDAPRFKSWLHHLVIMQDAKPSYLVPIAIRFGGHLLISLERRKVRERVLWVAFLSGKNLAGLPRSQEHEVTSTKLIEPKFKLPGAWKRKPLTLISSVAALLLFSLTPFFITEDSIPDQAPELVAVSVPEEPPI